MDSEPKQGDENELRAIAVFKVLPVYITIYKLIDDVTDW